MGSEGRRKQYVEVVATHRIDGSVRPQTITFAAGKVYRIDEVKSPALTQAGAMGEVARRYPVRVLGHDTYLYEDDGRWWVLMRN